MTFGSRPFCGAFGWRFLTPINNAEKPPKVRHFESSPLGAPSEKIGDDVCGKSDGIAFRWRFLATNAAQKWPRNDDLKFDGLYKYTNVIVTVGRNLQ